MTSVALPGFFAGVEVVSDSATFKFPSQSLSGMVLSYEKYATDVVGTFILTLTNVVVGSRIHVEKQSDGTSFYDDVAAISSVGISLSAYSLNSPYNDLRIKVRKASSSPSYQPWETQATAIVGSQSIYVSQIPDE